MAWASLVVGACPSSKRPVQGKTIWSVRSCQALVLKQNRIRCLPVDICNRGQFCILCRSSHGNNLIGCLYQAYAYRFHTVCDQGWPIKLSIDEEPQNLNVAGATEGQQTTKAHLACDAQTKLQANECTGLKTRFCTS